MALVRILVDGYSLLHGWPELAPGRARHSEAARDALIRVLTSFQDASGTPVTVFFDGASGPRKRSPGQKPGVEVLYSKAGQTADDLIERAAHRFKAYGDVLAVTDDSAERETVQAVGGLTSSCLNFIRQIEQALESVCEDIDAHNTRERRKFSRRSADGL